MRWTRSDTIGFAVATAILTIPPIGLAWYLDGYRKPGTPPTSLLFYLTTVGIGLAGAILSSAIAWRLGGSETSRWTIHASVASVMLLTFLIGLCIWLR